jgi:hypothetical protein
MKWLTYSGPSGFGRGKSMTEDLEWDQFASLPGVHLRRTTSLTGSKITGGSGELLLSRRGRTMTLAGGQVLQIDKRFPDRWQVADSGAASPVLWICNRHFDRQARGYVIFAGQAATQDFSERNRDLGFPVKGSRAGKAVMSAVIPASGTTVLWFRRLAMREHEVAVSPEWELTPVVLATIDLTAEWLHGFFESRHR